MHAAPIRKRRAGDDDWAKQFGADRRQHHHRPSALAVADDSWLAFGIRVQGDHLLEEDRLGARNVLDGLPRHGFGQETDEVTRVTCLEDDADFAVGLEPANAWPMARAWVHYDKRPPMRLDDHGLRRHDAHEAVVDGALKRAAIDDEFRYVIEHIWHGLGQMLAVLIAALAQ